MVVVLKQEATVLCLREQLKMEVRTSASSLAHALRACPGMLSGPGALWGLMFLRTLCTCPDETDGGDKGGVCLLSVVWLEVSKRSVEGVEVIQQAVCGADGAGAGPVVIDVL